MCRRAVLRLRFDERYRYRLRFGIHLHPQRVVSAPFGLLARLAAHDLNRAGRLLTADMLLGPAPGVDRGVDQFGARIRLAYRHRVPALQSEVLVQGTSIA
jgi:hypothetical protein